MNGGPSHVDTFDPKPQSPTQYRGTLEVIDTRLPGIQFSSLLPRTATILDRVTLCRGVSHVLASGATGSLQEDFQRNIILKFPNVFCIYDKYMILLQYVMYFINYIKMLKITFGCRNKSMMSL